MKRTNLIVDEALLAEAKQLLGAATQSDAVNQALAQTIKVLKIRRLAEFFGTGAWNGSLATMREDKPAGKKRRA
jgi:Arc/MetJ family transcription regulator